VARARSAAAAAQTPSSFFLDGGVFASIERSSHIELDDGVFPALDGTVAGGSVAAGAWVTRRVTVRVEFAFRGNLEASDSRTTGISFPPATTFTETRHDTDKLRSGSVLAAYHTRGDKAVRLEYIGGIAFAFVYLRRSSSTEISPAPPGLIFPRSETSSVSYGTAAVVGLDAPVRVARQVDLVPQIRAQSTGGLTIRPGISVRVRF
jgi:hypothetical protein